MNIYGLIGYALSHSFSQTYFTNKFKQENILNSRFDVFPIEQIKAFSLLVSQTQNIKGLAVTIPYKEAIIPFLNELDEVSEKIKAVNCIAFTPQGLKGFNTDVIGFEKSILPLIKPQHKKALVLGSGGASKAVVFVLEKLGIDYLIISRSKQEQKRSINYEEVDGHLILEHLLIINCSPIGQFPNVEDAPLIPYDFITNEHLVYDLVYNPTETRFLKLAKERGAIIKNGTEMLEIQAEENWRIWNQY